MLSQEYGLIETRLDRINILIHATTFANTIATINLAKLLRDMDGWDVDSKLIHKPTKRSYFSCSVK